MNIKKLQTHIKLCKRNLASDKIKCCASCPFEKEICTYYPELKDLFALKRRKVEEQCKSKEKNI